MLRKTDFYIWQVSGLLGSAEVMVRFRTYS